jgi:hypothetical protein
MDVVALLVIIFGAVTVLYAACWVFVLVRRASGNSARVMVLMRFERIAHPLIWIATLTASGWIISG